MAIKTIVAWSLRVSLCGVFGAAAFSQFTGDAQYISEFAKVGLGDWLRYAVATLEVVAIVLTMVPRTTLWGVSIFLFVTAGAFVAQLTVLHVGWYHCVILGVGLGALFVLAKQKTVSVKSSSA